MDILDNIPDWIKQPAILPLLQILYLIVKRILFGTQPESKNINVVVTLAIVHLAGFWGLMLLPDGLGVIAIIIYCVFASLAYVAWLSANNP